MVLKFSLPPALQGFMKLNPCLAAGKLLTVRIINKRFAYLFVKSFWKQCIATFTGGKSHTLVLWHRKREGAMRRNKSGSHLRFYVDNLVERRREALIVSAREMKHGEKKHYGKKNK